MLLAAFVFKDVRKSQQKMGKIAVDMHKNGNSHGHRWTQLELRLSFSINCVKLGVGLLVVMIRFTHLIAPVLTTSIILSCSKVENGDILVLAPRSTRNKWPLKWRECGMLHVMKQLHDVKIY